MNKVLLIETSSLSFRVSSNVITEATKKELKDGRMILRGVPATILGEKNANGRIYSTETLQQSIDRVKSEGLFERKRLLCSADDHPKEAHVPPSHASHIVVDAYIEKIGGRSYLLNDWLILDTSEGKNLRALIEAGSDIGTSIRGLGRFNEATSMIEDYEYLGTDVVGNPSAGTFTSHNDFKVEVVSESANKQSSILNEDKMSKFNLNDKIIEFKKNNLKNGKLATEKNEAVSQLLFLQQEAIQNGADLSTDFAQLKDIVLGAIKESADTDKNDSKLLTEGLTLEQANDMANKYLRQNSASEIIATEALKNAKEHGEKLIAARKATVSLVEAIKKVVAENAKDRDELKEKTQKVLEEQFVKFEAILAETLEKGEKELKEAQLQAEELVATVLDEAKKVTKELRDTNKRTQKMLEASMTIIKKLVSKIKEMKQVTGKDNKSTKHSRTIEQKLESAKLQGDAALLKENEI